MRVEAMTSRNAGTLAEQRRDWTIEDCRAFPKHMITPMESITLTWNGVQCHITAGEEVEIPEPFFDLYRDHLKALRNARQHEQWMLGKSDIAPDRNYLTDASMRVRGYTDLGKGSIGVGPLAIDEGTAEDAANG